MNRRSLADLVGLYLAPASASLLPWPLGFRWLRVLARSKKLYRDETESACSGAARFQAGLNREEFGNRQRFVRLVDHADLYLSRTRGDAWMERNLHVEGSWPTVTPFMALTLHWGNGLWSLRHLCRHGYHAALVSAPIGESGDRARNLRSRYSLLRNQEVARASGRPVIYTGRSLANIRAHLAANGVLVALLDVPRDQTPESIPASLIGRDSTLPRGLFRLAAELRIPMVFFRLGTDIANGERHLVIYPEVSSRSEFELARAYSEFFNATLKIDFAAWHRWSDVDRFFPASPGQNG